MKEESQNPKPLEAAIYETIRDYVARNDPEGLEYLQSFEDNLGTANEAAREQEFNQYLKVLFTSGPGLLDQLKVSHADNDQFINIVTGGHVEKIINIAKAGAVHIHETHVHQEHYLINFRSFVLLLSVLSAVSLIFGGVYWKSKQPSVLTGDLNIAVATFDLNVLGSGSDTANTAENISQMIYGFIDQEFNSPQYNLNVDVGHENIGVISGEDSAEQLAQSIHADIVIYGTVKVQDDNLIVAPRFYIANSIRADVGELIGSHQLELPQGLKTNDFNVLPTEEAEAKVKLLQNSEILIYFTQGLTYIVLSGEDPVGKDSYLRLALESIQTAITKSEELQARTGAVTTGNEVLYLFASRAAFLRGDQESAQKYIEKTLSIDECYGRAYIGQGNVFYARGVLAHVAGDGIFEEYFDQAIGAYEHALALDAGYAGCEAQPYGYYLPPRAHLGLGNVYSFLFQVGPYAGDRGLADRALGYFDQVITTHATLPKRDPGRALLTTLAANAHYQSGVIFFIQEKWVQASERFHRVIELADCTPLADKAKDQLERLGEAVPDTCGGEK